MLPPPPPRPWMFQLQRLSCSTVRLFTILMLGFLLTSNSFCRFHRYLDLSELWSQRNRNSHTDVETLLFLSPFMYFSRLYLSTLYIILCIIYLLSVYLLGSRAPWGQRCSFLYRAVLFSPCPILWNYVPQQIDICWIINEGNPLTTLLRSKLFFRLSHDNGKLSTCSLQYRSH